MAAETKPPDEECVRLAQQGSLDAFTILYERYLPMVYNRIRCSVPEPDVEDVIQEVFIAVMKSLKSFRGESLFRTWLRTLMSRQIADYYRRRSPDENPLDSEAMEGNSRFHSMPSVTPGSVALDDCIVLRQALNSLPLHYQEVLLLRFAEGLRFYEIASLHGQSLEATKSLFRRAVAALQKEMEVANV